MNERLLSFSFTDRCNDEKNPNQFKKYTFKSNEMDHFFKDKMVFDMSPYIFSDEKRVKESYVFTDFIGIDIDNDDHPRLGKKIVTMIDFIEMFQEYKFILLSSRSNKIDKEKSKQFTKEEGRVSWTSPKIDRYHVFFMLEKPESNIQNTVKIVDGLLKKYDFMDANCNNPVRFFYGNGHSDKKEYYVNHGEKYLDVSEFLIEKKELSNELDVFKPNIQPVPMDNSNQLAVNYEKTSLELCLEIIEKEANSGRFADYKEWASFIPKLKAGGAGFDFFVKISDPGQEIGYLRGKWDSFDTPENSEPGPLVKFIQHNIDGNFLKPGFLKNENYKKSEDVQKIIKMETEGTKVDFSGFSSIEDDLAPELINKIKTALVLKWGNKSGDLPNGFDVCQDAINLDPGFKYLIRYDTAKEMEVFPSRYPDIDSIYNAVLRRLTNYYGIVPSLQTRRDIIDTISSRDENRFNSIQELIEGILHDFHGDNSSVLKEIFDHFEYSKPRNDESSRKMFLEYWDLYFKTCALHIAGTFTGKLIPADVVPILVGDKEGEGKGRFCRFLGMAEITNEKFYVDIGDKDAKIGSTDVMRLIFGKIMVEMGEMSFLKKSEMDPVKAFISSTYDEYTEKFKTGTKKVKRTACFMGTSNMIENLKDPGSNRRWDPISIEKIDNDLYEKHHLARKLWAHYFKWAMNPEVKKPIKSKELVDFFDPIKKSSIQISSYGEMAMKQIKIMENEFFHTISNHRTTQAIADKKPLCIRIHDVVEIMFKDRTIAPGVESQIKAAFVKMNYESNQNMRVDGEVKKGFKKTFKQIRLERERSKIEMEYEKMQEEYEDVPFK